MIALKGVPCACDLHDISYIVSYVHMIVVSFLISTEYSRFCQAVSRKGLKEGSIIEIAITTPEGEKIETNLKVKDSDLELLKQLSELKM